MLPPLLLVALGGVIGYELLKGSSDAESWKNDGGGDGGHPHSKSGRAATKPRGRSGSVSSTEENEPTTQGKDHVEQPHPIGPTVSAVRSGSARDNSGDEQHPADSQRPETESVTETTEEKETEQ